MVRIAAADPAATHLPTVLREFQNAGAASTVTDVGELIRYDWDRVNAIINLFVVVLKLIILPIYSGAIDIGGDLL